MRLAATIVFCTTLAAQAPVRSGLDVLVAEDFARLEGARVGLVANHTSVLQDGRHAVTALRAASASACTLAALFSPEHGFAGVLDEEGIADGVHQSGIPIHSLYGETKKPNAEQLAGLDLLLFDLQDIGCRFYTYLSTLLLCMEACAENGVALVVLDRPNPIGGVAVQGPVLDAGMESFVGCHPLPVRHGMTFGELARLLAAERGLDLELRIVEMEGWRRAMLFDDTGRYWVNPSPNMRRLEQALLYPGVGLIEQTNVSVGRGTDTPFEIVGAPWIDGARLAARLQAAQLPGLSFVPRRFTPSASAFADELCEGVEVLITDRAQLDPLALFAALACALRDLHGDAWDRTRLPKLVADAQVLARIEGGKDAATLTAGWQEELSGFRERRDPFLLYR